MIWSQSERSIECREIEEHFGTLFSDDVDIIKKETTCSFKKMNKIIIEADLEMKIIIKKCGEKSMVTLPN